MSSKKSASIDLFAPYEGEPAAPVRKGASTQKSSSSSSSSSSSNAAAQGAAFKFSLPLEDLGELTGPQIRSKLQGVLVGLGKNRYIISHRHSHTLPLHPSPYPSPYPYPYLLPFPLQ